MQSIKKGGVSMAKRPSLGHQFWQVLESKKAMGESRHIAKIAAKEFGGKVEGIYSYKTYDAYKQASKTFCAWIKKEFPEVKYLDQIDKDHCAQYIKYREQSGCSAYTYSQDIAMINKVLNLGVTKEYCGVAKRSLNNITKNRTDNGFRTDTGAIETIIRGTGLRRNELVNLKVKDLLTGFNAVTGVMVSKGAKGGKFRIVEVRKEYQKPIYKLIESLESGSKVINEEIPKELQTHRLRSEYAQNMYKELIELGRNDPLQDLTDSMGHNRKSVLAYYGVKPKKIRA